jgi:hypothetical protein
MLVADLFLHAYEAEFFQGIKRKVVQNFKSSFRYIDDVLSLYNS